MSPTRHISRRTTRTSKYFPDKFQYAMKTQSINISKYLSRKQKKITHQEKRQPSESKLGIDSSMAEVNRLHFNEEASTYDTKHSKLNERLTKEIQSRLDWIGVDWSIADDQDDDDSDDDGDDSNEDEDEGSKNPVKESKNTQGKKEVRLLDYACGTGMMSRALAPYTTQCVGIDVSENMVVAYNCRAENQGLSRDEMYAVVGDLIALDGPQPSDVLADSRLFGFDVATVGGGLHHFADPELAADRLVERLRPGGVLLVWDFLPHGPMSGHVGNHGVMHHGLSEERVRKMFERAGAGQKFSLEVLGSGISIDMGRHGEKGVIRREIFLARGQKAV
ncbi:S-adenosyl-L-methionine-dependent methyltransferase [Annulohypoxylon truncatum]|uniref:S-adenosyl-L-methionine-dependent methyltransferase n=1 Tax=Annulohypoxylon truncatum TaxID=327061 RepID=UPI00200737B2|nr:S-adenosyl-L-methionine-dependent methyltransferase [Annulohypoxylon truncatum]KAI1212802.1 S-adenosyl-L-methionine-dependent methyltransferase [Annulohypoxylon truncatum]